MCVLAIIFILILLYIVWSCRSEKFGRGGPELDFLPTIGEIPTGEGGFVDLSALP